MPSLVGSEMCIRDRVMGKGRTPLETELNLIELSFKV
jgi:hypothetical protein